MSGADVLDAANALQCFGRSGVIIVMGSVPSAGGEDPGVVWSTDDDADSAAFAKRQKTLQRILLEKRVAARQKKDIEVSTLREPLARFPSVQPRADRALPLSRPT